MEKRADDQVSENQAAVNQASVNQASVTPASEKQVSEEQLLGKLKGSARKAGRETIVTALKLYYALQDKDTPTWVKTVICGSLAYFIIPIDAIPDFLPGGYVDDLGTLLAAVASLKSSIKSIHGEKAEQVADKYIPVK